MSNLALLAAGAAHSEAPELEAFGFAPGWFVALAMAVFIGILIWKKVPAMITGGLDKQIDAIRKQLDDAKALRTEAEALRADYLAKIAGAEKDAAAMIEHAGREASAIIAKAETDAAAMIVRREQMATDKIAASERAVIDELRAHAASTATAAATTLIAAHHSAQADRALVDSAIAGLAN